MSNTCKLCKNETKLLKKSHLIPDFMYKNIYDEEHKLMYISSSKEEGDKKGIGFQYTGEYEKYILCKKCDNEILGKLESYAAFVLNGGRCSKESAPIYQNIRLPNGSEFALLQNLLYDKFKLFLSSLGNKLYLWANYLLYEYK